MYKPHSSLLRWSIRELAKVPVTCIVVPVMSQGRQVLDLCRAEDNMRSRLLIGMAILFFQQVRA